MELTGEEALHAVAVSHFEETPARVGGQGGVSSIRQQDPHHVQVIVLHSVVNGSEHTEQEEVNNSVPVCYFEKRSVKNTAKS